MDRLEVGVLVSQMLLIIPQYSMLAVLACHAGQYRSALNNSCIDCPANSTSKEASEYCFCIDGHFRASPNEGIGVKCIGMYIYISLMVGQVRVYCMIQINWSTNT